MPTLFKFLDKCYNHILIVLATSQYAQKNNYYQASALQGGGVNQYGAHYSSGIRDEDVGNAYYNSSQ